MSTWSIRVKSRMKELGMTQEMLAGKMGVTRGAITHYLAGRRMPPLKQFQKLAAILKADPAWLQFGTARAKKHITSSICKNPIPILSWEQVADFVDVANIAKDELKEFVPNFYTDKPRWFALHVRGDSMTASP